MFRLPRVILVALLFLANSVAAAELPRFEAQTLDPHAGEVCYAVTTADVDGDGKKDIIVVTENRVLWYHNPDWKMRVIIADQTERDNVCIAPYDIDGDGKIDFALGAGWLNNRHLGTLFSLTRSESLDQPWKVHQIGQESWTHRIKFGDLLGTGKSQLIVSPLNKTRGDGVRMLALSIPDSPADIGKSAWKVNVLDEALNSVHAHWTGDLNGDGKTDLITASMEGVFLFQRTAKKGSELTKTRLGRGIEGAMPAPQKTGAGEIKVGKLKSGRSYIATVEPMHGTHAVVYVEPAAGEPRDSDELNEPSLWNRIILDETLGRGHAIWTADIDQDGNDEFVLGHSDKGTSDSPGPGVFYYRTEDNGQHWTKHTIDQGGVATEDLIAEDLNGDLLPDVVAVGRATHNVKLYINRGKK